MGLGGISSREPALSKKGGAVSIRRDEARSVEMIMSLATVPSGIRRDFVGRFDRRRHSSRLVLVWVFVFVFVSVRFAAGAIREDPFAMRKRSRSRSRSRKVAPARAIVGRLAAVGVSAWFFVGPIGCATVNDIGVELNQFNPFRPEIVVPNPLNIPTNDFNAVWKTSLEVVDDYFDIATEDAMSQTIQTEPRIGATLLEPWYGDSADMHSRLEATLQTIRRFAIVRIEQAGTGSGYVVRVEVFKELEDLAKPDRQTSGRATFTSQFPVNRAREVVGPLPLASGWIPRGRDTRLEQKILERIKARLSAP